MQPLWPNSPRYADEVANDPFNVLGLDPLPLGGRREANNRSATVVSATGKQRESFLQQWQNVQRPDAVHGAGRSHVWSHVETMEPNPKT